MNNQEYITENFVWSEVVLKGEKQRYIEGFITTKDRDSSGDVITDNAQNEIVSYLKSAQVPITMDVDHEDWLDDNGQVLPKPKGGRIPIAKIIEAEKRDNGVWVKAVFNNDSPIAEPTWKSIMNKFLHSFSIAFYPLKSIKRVVGDTVTNLIDSIDLVQVTLTGAPVNKHATFVPVMKAVAQTMEDKKMSDEQKQEQPKTAEEPKQDTFVSKEEFEKLQVAIKELTESKEKLTAELSAVTTKFQESQAKQTESIDGPMAQIKSLIKEIAELKAELNKPIMKSEIHQLPKDTLKTLNPLDSI